MAQNQVTEWNPKGLPEIVAEPMLVEIDEIEPRDGAHAPVNTPVGREIASLLVAGKLDGPISDEVGARLRTLGRLRLLETGVNPDEFRAAYFSANPDRLPS